MGLPRLEGAAVCDVLAARNIIEILADRCEIGAGAEQTEPMATSWDPRGSMRLRGADSTDENVSLHASILFEEKR